MFSAIAILNGLVLGTGDKSEMSLGYFTKYGDGAADLFPISGHYNQPQVRALARYLSIPDEIINKESSARLWKQMRDLLIFGSEFLQNQIRNLIKNQQVMIMYWTLFV